MAFCPRCGKSVEEGQICDCTVNVQNPAVTTQGQAIIGTKSTTQGFLLQLKNRIGIGDPERNTTDTYERDMKIVPDNISPCENEIPVRQYNVAILRNRLRFEQTEGRLQITNKRLIFRATGRSFGRRISMQQEFNIDEIGGVETMRNYRFSGFHLIVGLLLVLIGICVGAFISAPSRVIGTILGLAGLLPFFIFDRNFSLKLSSLGVSVTVKDRYGTRQAARVPTREGR